MATVLAREAEAQLSAYNTKKIMRTSPNYKELGTVKVFNVGPWEHTISMGGMGSFHVPKCLDANAYSDPLEIYKMLPECFAGATNNDLIEVCGDGLEFAKSIIGGGKFQTRSSDLRPFGVFIAAGDKPTKEELSEANDNLGMYLLALVEEADLYQQEGPKSWPDIGARHRYAAIRTGNGAKIWVHGAAKVDKCPVCKSGLEPDTAICVGCKTVINPEIVKKHRTPGYEYLWATPAVETQKGTQK